MRPSEVGVLSKTGGSSREEGRTLPRRTHVPTFIPQGDWHVLGRKLKLRGNRGLSFYPLHLRGNTAQQSRRADDTSPAPCRPVPCQLLQSVPPAHACLCSGTRQEDVLIPSAGTDTYLSVCPQVLWASSAALAHMVTTPSDLRGLWSTELCQPTAAYAAVKIHLSFIHPPIRPSIHSFDKCLLNTCDTPGTKERVPDKE